MILQTIEQYNKIMKRLEYKMSILESEYNNKLVECELTQNDDDRIRYAMDNHLDYMEYITELAIKGGIINE